MAKEKKVKVTFVQSPGGYKLAYHVGESALLPEEQAKELIAKGFAIPFEDAE